MEDLKRKERWTALWMRQGIEPERSLWAYDRLRAHYAEPHRAYHTMEHIDFCLAQLDRFRHLTKDPDALEIALWYHDEIYDPTRKDNEWRSAHSAWLAMRILMPCPKELRKKVIGLILATTHKRLLTDPDKQLIADIDLSGFAQSRDETTGNTRKVRFEYRAVPLPDFVRGHGAILQSFLKRPSIYYHSEIRRKCEDMARENIRYILHNLQSLAKLS
jgi:predicted metal-dependent HD superfamily phosphohydrolase